MPRLSISTKKLLRLRETYSKLNYSFNFYFKRIISFFKTLSKSRYRKINIKLQQNNVFCTLTNIKHKTLHTSSSGKCKIKTSKKTIKFTNASIIKSFLKDVKNQIRGYKILILIIAPKNLRQKIINQLCTALKNKNIFITIQNKKNFNGCRSKKQKRKKRKGLRIFK